MSEELKPCPFCGNNAKLHIGATKNACLCDNEKCILFARVIYIDAWNTRPTEPQQVNQGSEWESVEDNTIETIVDGFSDRVKVPGGWIYRYWNEGCREINSSVFVPQPTTNTEEEG